MFIATESSEPNSFNPLVIEDAASGEIADLFLSSLTTSDPVTQEIIPALAKSWEYSADQKTLVVHLRKGLLWSDGQPLTADDVLFTFKAIFDPRFPNRNSQQLTIAGKPLGVDKIDDSTIRFTTADLYSPLLNDLGSVNILPRHVLQKFFDDGTLLKQWTVETGQGRPESMVSSGPFRLLSYRPGDRILLEANPHYWRADSAGQRLPYIDLYVVKFVKDQNAELIHFATGQADISGISAADVGWVERAQKTYDFTIHDRGPSSSISFIWFNMNPGKSPDGKPYVPPHKLKWFQDARFRQALSYAFNRQGIIDGVYFGRASALHSIISSGNFQWHNSQTPQFAYDPAKAVRLLEEAGFHKKDGVLLDGSGNPVEFEILTPQGSAAAPQIITSFMEDLRELGIKAKMSFLDFGTMIARTGQSFDYEAGIMGFTGGGDPSGGKALYMTEGRLHVWNPEQKTPATPWEARVDELMRQQERTFDKAKRKKLIDEMQVIFAEERPLTFLVTPNAYVGMKNRWQNTTTDMAGRFVYRIDEIWAKETSP